MCSTLLCVMATSTSPTSQAMVLERANNDSTCSHIRRKKEEEEEDSFASRENQSLQTRGDFGLVEGFGKMNIVCSKMKFILNDMHINIKKKHSPYLT